MSEKPQLHPEVSEKPEVTAKPPSGFVEEGRARERVEECPAGRSESERTLSRHVSRDTQETSELTPEQKMLNDIMDRAMAKSQGAPKEDKPETPTQREAPGPEKKDAPPSPPEKNKPSSAYVYLAVLFGAAFLMLLLAYFVQQRNNDDVLDDLRSTTASREELLEQIQELEKENEALTGENARLDAWADQKSNEAKQLSDFLDDSYYRQQEINDQKMCLSYVWYLQRFMDAGDYPLAAAEVAFSAEFLRSTWEKLLTINPALLEQYDGYKQELIRRGYLQHLDRPRDGGTDIYFTDRWDPSRNEDTAALSNLWCALEYHFIMNHDNAASQILYNYPLGDPVSGYQERVERLASDFTLEQFQLMKNALVEDNWLVIAEDGAMSEGDYMGLKDDALYNLPFKPPATGIKLE